MLQAAYDKQNILNERTKLKEDIKKVMEDNYRLRQFLEKYENQTHGLKDNVFHVKQKSELLISGFESRKKPLEAHYFVSINQSIKRSINASINQSIYRKVQCSMNDFVKV